MEDTFLEIYNLYKNDIYRLAYSYTKNFSDADDILQNTFIKLYNHNDILSKGKIEIKKWLIKIAINECKSLLLSSWYKRIISLTEKEENIFHTERKDNDVLNALWQLNKKYRLIIYLYYYEGYKAKEISEILNLSETNIQTILLRARKELKSILKEEWYYEE